jgi:hypothetical protein
MSTVKWEGGARIAPKCSWLMSLGVAALLVASLPAGAATVEYRDFTIQVDGKPAGYFRVTITEPGNGTIVMAGEANVKFVHHVVLTYQYSYRGTETWKGHRLLRLQSFANEDGKRLAVDAIAQDESLKINGRETKADVWTTTYWRLPEARFRNGSVTLLDADTGNLIEARVQSVGANALNVGGQMQNCAHYRVTGKDIQVDAWYDSQERLVRQESVEQGHRSVLELTGLRR